jgi:hypothetical protein
MKLCYTNFLRYNRLDEVEGTVASSEMATPRQQFSIRSLLLATTIVACGCGFWRALGGRGVALVLLMLLMPIVAAALVKLYGHMLSIVVDFVLRPFLRP